MKTHQLLQSPQRRPLIKGVATLPIVGMTGMSGCASIAPSLPQTQETASQVLARGRVAHGGASFDRMNDINISFDGEWYNLIRRIQPDIVDIGYRKESEERFLTKEAVHAQVHSGPQGTKYVLRDGRETRVVRSGGVPTTDGARAAAGLVIDAYRLFTLAPFELEKVSSKVSMADPEYVNGVHCDVVIASILGIGWNGGDTVQAFYDRKTHLMQRIRMTIDALPSTKGAVVEVDFSEFRKFDGLMLPTRYFERVTKPFRLSAHRWWLTGFDSNRGYGKDALQGITLQGLAARPATAWKA